MRISWSPVGIATDMQGCSVGNFLLVDCSLLISHWVSSTGPSSSLSYLSSLNYTEYVFIVVPGAVQNAWGTTYIAFDIYAHIIPKQGIICDFKNV